MKNKFILSLIAIFACQFFVSCGALKKDTESNKAPQEESQLSDEGNEESSNSSSKNDNYVSTNNKNNENSNIKTDENKDISQSSGNKTEISKKDLKIYYYDIENNKIIPTMQTINVSDNAVVNSIIDAYKGSLDDPCYSGIPDYINVTSATLDKKNDKVTVNFKDKFIDDIGYTKDIEKQVLQSIVNSIGYNLNVHNVYININNTPFTPDYNNIQPFKAIY